MDICDLLNNNDDKYLFKNLPDKLKRIKIIVLEAVQKDGLNLEYAYEYFKDDEEIALEAVNNNGLALEFVSERLKNNEKICYIAVQNNQNAINFIPKSLLINNDFRLKAFKKYLLSPLFLIKYIAIANKKS